MRASLEIYKLKFYISLGKQLEDKTEETYGDIDEEWGHNREIG